MRICSGAGCLRVVRDDVRYCDECKPAPLAADTIREHTAGYNRELDRLRMGRRWERTRKTIIQRQPLCARCEVHYTEIVDHIVPAQVALAQARASSRYSMDPTAGYFLLSNLQGLCRSCHGKKTTEDKAHQGEWPDVLAKEAVAPKKVWSF